jgi:hypothetical protein
MIRNLVKPVGYIDMAKQILYTKIDRAFRGIGKPPLKPKPGQLRSMVSGKARPS